MKIDIAHPHDLLVKSALSHKSVMADLLKGRLPKSTLEKLDLSSLKLEKSSFVSENLRATQSDVVYSLMHGDKRGYAYVLLEAQSTYDRAMPIRLIEYNCQLWRLHQKRYKEFAMPPIINLVLYSGQKAYPGPKTFLNCLATPELSLEIAQNTFVIDLLSDAENKILRDEKAALLELVLRGQHLRDFCHLIDQVPQLGALLLDSDYAQPTIIYMMAFEPHPPEQLIEKIVKLAPGKKEEIMSALEILQNRGYQKGMEEGMQKKMASIAKAMHREGLALSLISKYLELPVEEIKMLLHEAEA